jgi:hypothetical protein
MQDASVGTVPVKGLTTPVQAHERLRAEAYYREALKLAGRLHMRPPQAHCHPGLGTLCATIGRKEQAQAELSTAIERYRAMEMTFWLPQAEAALAQGQDCDRL